MTEAEFKVGQVVCLRATRRTPAASRTVAYKVLRLLPLRGADRSYVIKTILEREERIADHDELVLLSALWRSSISPLLEKDNVMTDDRIEAFGDDIHVLRGPGDGWRVRQGDEFVSSANYRLRAHAMAFARAFAFSSHADMIVHGRGGLRTRHAHASLSYPTTLD